MPHIHLDPVGGVAGDMFVGALLDLYPQYAAAAIQAVRDAGLDESVSLAQEAFSDGTLSGSRFVVGAPPREVHGDHHHHHVHWSTLKARLLQSGLDAGVRARAVDVFGHLAEAEARVHGKPVETVAFHEVGAWDSIADIVAAAAMIEALGACSWSIGVLPLGSGRVSTEHGVLPVPAPATVLLLEGFECLDDGFPGERVTPTGAAILRHLAPAKGIGRTPRVLGRTGLGFGSRRIAGMSNVLRAIQFEEPPAGGNVDDQVLVLSFEIDDQSPEDLAIALDRLRAHAGVIDVVQGPVLGKRGRMMNAVRLLAEPAAREAVLAACFTETTTIGIRVCTSDRVVLSRAERRSDDGLNVKIVRRPAGVTAKADISGVLDSDGHAARQSRRHAAETESLRGERDDQ